MAQCPARIHAHARGPALPRRVATRTVDAVRAQAAQGCDRNPGRSGVQLGVDPAAVEVRQQSLEVARVGGMRRRRQGMIGSDKALCRPDHTVRQHAVVNAMARDRRR